MLVSSPPALIAAGFRCSPLRMLRGLRGLRGLLSLAASPLLASLAALSAAVLLLRASLSCQAEGSVRVPALFVVCVAVAAVMEPGVMEAVRAR